MRKLDLCMCILVVSREQLISKIQAPYLLYCVMIQEQFVRKAQTYSNMYRYCNISVMTVDKRIMGFHNFVLHSN